MYLIKIMKESTLAMNYKNSCIENDLKLIIKDVDIFTSNSLYTSANKKKKVDVYTAYIIAYNWREITKNFLFKSIIGLGNLAKKIEADLTPERLLTLQTSFQIISDDLNNSHLIFKKNAPPGTQGIHFKWWENTILAPLAASLRLNHTEIKLFNGTLSLTKKMEELSLNYLGVAVQLRIVESIAFDICKAFFVLFSNVEYMGKKVFYNKNDLLWITVHMQVEQFHHLQTCDLSSGMTNIITNAAERKLFLELSHDYANAWKIALKDFTDFIKKSPSELPY